MVQEEAMASFESLVMRMAESPEQVGQSPSHGSRRDEDHVGPSVSQTSTGTSSGREYHVTQWPSGSSSEDSHDQLPRMRKAVKLFSKGDFVELYSGAYKRWMLDGEVTEVLKETALRGGLKIRAGSMKVQYADGSRSEWVAPQQIRLLRPSSRPREPDRKSGELQLMDEERWLFRWREQYAEIRKGQLLWWDSQESANNGKSELGSLHLLGTDLEVAGAVLKFNAASTGDVIHAFAAASVAEAKDWSAALAEHAAYAASMKELMRQSKPRSVSVAQSKPMSLTQSKLTSSSSSRFMSSVSTDCSGTPRNNATRRL